MQQSDGVNRRYAIRLGATALGTIAVVDLVEGPASLLAATAGPTEGIGYFSRFRVTRGCSATALAAALASGGDRADVFFQHRVSNSFGLEDGEVNRAYTERRARRRGPGRQGGPDRLRLHRGADARAAVKRGRADRRRRRRRAGGAPGRRRFHVGDRPADALSGDVPLGRGRAGEEAARSSRGAQRAGLRRRPARQEGTRRRSPTRRRDPHGRLDGRIVEDAQPMTRLYSSCVAETGRTPGAERLQRRRPGPASGSTRRSGSTGW